MRKIKLFVIALSVLTLCACAQENETVVIPSESMPTATVAPTVTVVPTVEATPTIEVVSTPTVEVAPTVEVVPTVEATPTIEVVEPTVEVVPTVVPTPTVEVTPTPTVEVVSTPTVAPTSTPTPTVAPTSTPVPTVVPTAIPTVVPTSTPVPTKKPTPTVTPTPVVSSLADDETAITPERNPKFFAMLEEAAVKMKAYRDMQGKVDSGEMTLKEFEDAYLFGVRDFGYVYQESAPDPSACYKYWLESLGIDCEKQGYLSRENELLIYEMGLSDAFSFLDLDDYLFSAHNYTLCGGEDWTPRVYPRVQIIGGEGQEPIILTDRENAKIIEFIDEANRLKATLPYDKKFIEDCYDITSTEEEAKELIKRWSSPAPYVLDYWATKVARQRAYMLDEEFEHLSMPENISMNHEGGISTARGWWNSQLHRPGVETFGDRLPDLGTGEINTYGLFMSNSRKACLFDDTAKSAEEYFYLKEMVAWREAHPELKGIAY